MKASPRDIYHRLLNTANTAVEAAGLFCRHYERPANYAARMKKREEAAARFAAEFSHD